MATFSETSQMSVPSEEQRAQQLTQFINQSTIQFPLKITMIGFLDSEMCEKTDPNELAECRAIRTRNMTDAITTCATLGQHGWELIRSLNNLIDAGPAVVRARAEEAGAHGDLIQLIMNICDRATAVAQQEIGSAAQRFGGVVAAYCQRAGVPVRPEPVQALAFEPIELIRVRLIEFTGGRQGEVDALFQNVATRHWDMMAMRAGLNDLITRLVELKRALDRDSHQAIQRIQGLGGQARTARNEPWYKEYWPMFALTAAAMVILVLLTTLL
jgi:hypothetical protein